MRELELILVFILHSKGVTAGTSVYHLPGDNGTLPCNSLPSFSSCSKVNWIYNSNVNTVNVTVVEGGNVKSSQQSARLNVDSNCSLIITNIAPEDAGCYTCHHHGEPNNLDTQVFLNILTIYTSRPHNGPAKDRDVSLECTLWRHAVDGSCPKESLRWVDETETVLPAKDQGNCVSLLTLKNHHKGNRRYTCRFLEGKSMKIEGHYKPFFKDPAPNQPILITIAVMIVVVLMLVIIAAIFLKRRRRTRLPDDEPYTNDQNPTSQRHRCDFNAAYASIDHSKSKGSRKKKAKEEEDTVYYSAIRTNVDISTAASLNQDKLNRK
ncbi:hypothetical protein CRENBAI_000668 [Crenichthys baileyi]|uniref:Ig-like domain-containing protein n=1 Tax=Crenichthys baileyi TaxID=28760 RepID=A0AAV9R4D8_9TELE